MELKSSPFKCKMCGVDLICGVNCYRSNFMTRRFYCNKCWYEYGKKYYNKERHREVNKRYRQRHPDADKEYYEHHKEKWDARRRMMLLDEKKHGMNLEYQRNYHKSLRLAYLKAAIKHYGGKCECCGEDDILFLTLDHVNNDGADWRRKMGKKFAGWGFYKWLVDNNFPEDQKLRVLCFNCNCGRERNGGVCPHKQIIGEGFIPKRGSSKIEKLSDIK